jgi:hypothetical protein
MLILMRSGISPESFIRNAGLYFRNMRSISTIQKSVTFLGI